MTQPPRSPAAPPLAATGAADLIFLRDHVVEAEIGAYQIERGVTQRLRFNLVASLAKTPTGARRDDVDAVLSYDILADAIRDALATGRLDLLETLAEDIAARVLGQPAIAGISIRIEKLDRLSGTLGIEIQRQRPGAAAPASADAPPRARPAARVVVIPEARLADPALAPALRDLLGPDPAVLCVDAAAAPDCGVPVPVQRRIDLLGFEQAAWRLAALDPRFVVVGSRTELDWGLRNGQVSVWAPSKMVVDARADAPPSPLRMADLSVWLAHRIGAQRIECAGALTASTLPAGLEVRHITLAAAE